MAEVGATQAALGLLTAAAASFKDVDWDLVSSYVGLLSLATFCVYTGAYGSLPKRKKDPKSKSDSTSGGVECDDDEGEELFEYVSSEDAWLFPLVGSVLLGGFYLIVVYLGDYWINIFLRMYLSVAGIGSVWNPYANVKNSVYPQSSINLTRYIVGEARWKNFEQVKLMVKKGSHVTIALSGRTPSVVLLLFALLPSGLYVFWNGGKRSVFLADILAISFAHNAISMVKIDSFRTGTILLAGLFVYDVWWVFGTEVMVKVATTLDVPIKLLWPKSILFGNERGYTMLGLGDVVIPGTFVALALRYDYYLQKKREGFRKLRYFYGSLCGYILGLIATMVVMHVVGKAQPALLYLSPACLMSFLLTGMTDGELGDAWKWRDG